MCLFGDGHVAFRRNLSDGIPNIGPAITAVFQVLETSKISSADIITALDQVAGDESIGQFIQLMTLPAVIPISGTNYGGCIGNSTAKHNVRTLCERCCNSQPTQIALGIDGLERPVGQFLARVDVAEIRLPIGKGLLNGW